MNHNLYELIKANLIRIVVVNVTAINCKFEQLIKF